MAVKSKLWTYDDYIELIKQNNDKRYEIINGELIELMPPNIKHQKISIELSSILNFYVKKKRLGEVFAAPCEVKLGDYPYEPDIIFVSNSNIGIIEKNRIVGSPDLIIEIMSPESRKRDKVEKYRIYEEYCVKEYWIIDPDKNSVNVYILEDGKYRLSQELTETGVLKSSVIRGFEVDIPEFIN
jgi:Uma2 family endonuclease